jgi:Glycosyltransferase family 87
VNKTYAKYIKVLVCILAVYYAFKCAHEGHDFQVFVYAGGKLIHGQNIYFPPFVQNLQYYYSPLFALLLSPFSRLPIIIPQVIWILISYVLLYRIWVLSTSYFDTSALTVKQKIIWLLVSVFLSIRFILVDIGYVQMTIFLLWATLESMQLINNGKWIWGAALLALAINIKLLPFAFVVYLFYRGRFKAAILTCAFYVIYLFLPAIYLGWDRNLSLIHDWFAIINPLNKQWTIEAEDGPSSLVALIPVYLTKTTGVLTFKRNFLDLTFAQVSLILNIVRLLFVLLTLMFLHSLPFKNVPNKVRRFWEMSYLFILVPLIFPHQQQYAFVYITPAFIYLTWFFITNWKAIRQKMNFFYWAILAVIAFNFSPLIGRDIITSHFFEVLLYLRILPIAVIMLIPILWICRPALDD